MLVSLAVLTVAYFLPFTPLSLPERAGAFCEAVQELVHLMWWGVALGIVAVGLLQYVPQRRIEQWLGSKSNLSGLTRAVIAGVVFDVCSHGILLVSMQLYRKGLSLGQTMAFLIASPWNSFSMTLVLVALIGLKWTLVFIATSVVIAFLSGMLFNLLEQRGVVPSNPYREKFESAPDDEPGFWKQIGPQLKSPSGWWGILKNAISESTMIIRWILVGILFAAILRIALDPVVFASWFGPTIGGLGLTLIAATLIEVCSEGSSPIAGDLLNRASAPGNGFAFLMAGVATDYTEILSIKSTMKSWKIALLLPVITIPQILLIGWLLNQLTPTL